MVTACCVRQSITSSFRCGPEVVKKVEEVEMEKVEEEKVEEMEKVEEVEEMEKVDEMEKVEEEVEY